MMYNSYMEHFCYNGYVTKYRKFVMAVQCE